VHLYPNFSSEVLITVQHCSAFDSQTLIEVVQTRRIINAGQ
jgi:hypothetical protein